MTRVLTKRKEFDGVNVEFEITASNVWGSLSGVTNQSTTTIIKDIEDNVNYYTLNNGILTPVLIEGGNKVDKYLSSIPNGETDDNIDTLPTYE